jgi:RNA polymerase-binding transcription factor DksA
MIDTSQYKEKIEAQLKNIITELETIGTYDAENDDWKAVPEQEKSSSPDADVNSNADVVEEWNERRATLSDLEIEYRDLKRALKKIADGTYGVCEVSGEPIEEKRLAAKPDARTCIAHMNDETQLPL